MKDCIPSLCIAGADDKPKSVEITRSRSVARQLLFSTSGTTLMMDLLFLVVIVGFFAGALAYVEGCERL